MPQYLARTDRQSYPISAETLAQLDLRRINDGENYHLLHEGRAYRISVLNFDRVAKTVRLRVNGRDVSYRLLDEVDQAIDALGFATADTTVTKDVYAPMPGLVLDILVEPGQAVAAGTPLLILEAMKMENILKAEADGTVVEVSVEKGAAVEKKQLLLRIE